MSALLRFWLSHRAELAGADRPARAAGRRVDRLRGGHRRSAGHLRGAPAAVERAAGGLANLVQTIPSLAMFGFLLPLPLLGGVGPRTAVVVLDPLWPAADRPHDHRRPPGHRPVDPRGRRGDGDDRRRAAAAGRAAAGDAVDRRRHPRRRRRRRRLGHHRRGDWRGRPRRIHLSRAVDGRYDRDPRRRDSRRGAGARRGRRAAVDRAHARAAPPSASPAKRSLPSPRSPAVLALGSAVASVFSRASGRSSSARRTSPSS